MRLFAFISPKTLSMHALKYKRDYVLYVKNMLRIFPENTSAIKYIINILFCNFTNLLSIRKLCIAKLQRECSFVLAWHSLIDIDNLFWGAFILHETANNARRNLKATILTIVACVLIT